MKATIRNWHKGRKATEHEVNINWGFSSWYEADGKTLKGQRFTILLTSDNIGGEKKIFSINLRPEVAFNMFHSWAGSDTFKNSNQIEIKDQPICPQCSGALFENVNKPNMRFCPECKKWFHHTRPLQYEKKGGEIHHVQNTKDS